MSLKVQYLFDLVDKISPRILQIQSRLELFTNRLQTQSQNAAKYLEALGGKFRSAGLALAPASAAIGGVGIMAIKSAANFETLGIQLEILTGSAEKGGKLFQDLTKYAAETPFELPEIVSATRTLLGSNIALESVVDTTKMLGNVAAGSGASVQSLATVFGQVAGMTKLHGQDAMQFVSNGIPIWALLQKSTGKSIGELRKLGEKGQISFKMVEEAMTKATQKGGMYYQATDKLSKSLSGLWSTLKDNVNLALGSVGDTIVETFELKDKMKAFGDFTFSLATAFKNLSPGMRSFIVYIGLAVTTLAPLLIAIGLTVPAFAVMAKGISLVCVAITFLNNGLLTLLANPILLFLVGLTAILVLLYNKSESFRTVVDFLTKSLWDGLGVAFKFISEVISDVISDIGYLLSYLTDLISKLSFVQDGFNAIKSGASWLKENTYDAAINKINDKLDEKAGLTTPQSVPLPQQAIAQQNKINVNGSMQSTIRFENPPQGVSLKQNRGMMEAY